MYKYNDKQRLISAVAADLVIVASENVVAKGSDTSLFTNKQTFSLRRYTTLSGSTIQDLQIGYESYGVLNAEKSNAILITHFFSGNSHAAGKYSPEDAEAGYWDNLIGPGKIIDTDKYYVISSDTLVNLEAHNPKVVTTGPASINPATSKPYALSFPQVAIEDFVNVQKALLDDLGIKKLHAVAGASMGSLQAIVWAAKYPEMVPRVMAVVSPGPSGTPYLIAQLKRWADVIKLDPNWQEGDYYTENPPLQGLALALQSLTIDAFQRPWLEEYDTSWADKTVNLGFDFNAQYDVEKMLDDLGVVKAKIADANHFLYLVKANQSYDVRDEIPKMKAKFLFLPAQGDLVFPPSEAQAFAAVLKRQGNEVDLQILAGPFGHINGLAFVPQAKEKILKWLE